MKKTTYLAFICIVVMSSGCGRPVPCDKNGNPICNSIYLATFSLSNCAVDAYYYTMTNNIENPGSADFVSKTPTAAQAEHYAVTESSYFFLIHSNRNVSCMVLLDEVGRTRPMWAKYLFTIIRSPKKHAERVLLPYSAPLTEHRADELVNGPWDRNARMLRAGEARMCVFNGSTNAVLAFATILSDLEKLIASRKLYQ
jgi:hypothetical protein